MEIFGALTLAASPFLIKWVLNAVKQVSGAAFWKGTTRTNVFRFLAVVLAFVASVVNQATGGPEVGLGVVTTFVDTTLVFVSSTGFYYWSKYKNR